MNYDPHFWYWLADDGRIFSGPAQAQVPSNDPGYGNFLTAQQATPWPRDGTGAQTDASMQDVLTPYGDMFVDLTYYTADARFRKEVGGITVGGVALRTDRVSQSQRDAAHTYLAMATAGTTIAWKNADNSFTTLTAAQLATQMQATAGYVQDCFACENTTLASITGGTITTRAEVDAAFAAIPTAR
jgi:surface antigen